MLNTFSTFPSFILYLVVSVGMIALFTFLYTRVTPHDEFAGIRNGNAGAAIGLFLTTLGFALPLASVIFHSSHIVDVVLWGLVALLIQLATFFVAARIVPTACRRVDDNCVASGVFLGGWGLIMGVLQAACLTY